MPLRRPIPLSPRSGVVRHTDTMVPLDKALERVPPTERVAVVMENAQTGLATRTTWSRLAVAVALRKGFQLYGIYETVGRARNEGFGIVTQHPTLAKTFIFIDTTLVAPAEVAP